VILCTRLTLTDGDRAGSEKGEKWKKWRKELSRRMGKMQIKGQIKT